MTAAAIATTARLADIKRSTGFVTADGTMHATLKDATKYVRDLKVSEALKDFALVTPETSKGVSLDDNGSGAVIFCEDLPAFLLAHREDIMAAFSQGVALRASNKTPKVKVAKVKEAKTPKSAAQLTLIQSDAQQPTEAPVVAALATESTAEVLVVAQ